MIASKPNTVIQFEGYYISFNFRDIGIYGGVTTALVVGEMEHFYILNGDHRSQYKTCNNFQECVEYFKCNKELKNFYSEEPPQCH